MEQLILHTGRGCGKLYIFKRRVIDSLKIGTIMKILTTDNRLLWLDRIGEVAEKGSQNLYCKDDAGKTVVITWQDIALSFGTYTFAPSMK